LGVGGGWAAHRFRAMLSDLIIRSCHITMMTQSWHSNTKFHVTCVHQVVDAAISESVFNMLESCVTEAAAANYDRPPSGSTISGV